MNVYQSNFNPHYYNQPNHLLISPSSASSIYSGQSLGDEHFYANIDNSNHSLIHMFINSNEPKPDQKALELYPNSAFTSFSSPSPSSSYNSSNGSGQMVANWTPNSQAGQEEPVVLCQLDELTKNLNNNQMNSKKSKLITLDVSYNQIPNAVPNSDRQKSEPLDLPMANYEPHVFNGHCLPPTEQQQFLIQQQFNADLVHQQIAMQQPSIQLVNGDRATHHIPQPLPPNDHSSQIPPANVKPSLPIAPASNGPPGNKLNPAISQTMPLNQQQPTQQSSSQQPQFQSNRLNLASCRLKPEQAAGGHLLNAIIGYDSEGRPIRNANKKERRRTLSINNAFSNLRDCIPNVPSDTKLSKIKTLRLATSYISYLMDLLDDSSPINGKRNRMMMTCEDFKVDLQRFKGRNKNIHLIYPTKFAVSFASILSTEERLMFGYCGYHMLVFGLFGGRLSADLANGKTLWKTGP